MHMFQNIAHILKPKTQFGNTFEGGEGGLHVVNYMDGQGQFLLGHFFSIKKTKKLLFITFLILKN